MTDYRKSSLAVLLLLCFLFCSFPALADGSPQVVRIGFCPLTGLQNVTADGKLSGYLYDYLIEIAHHTGWKYEFYIGDLDDCIDKLKNGELDLVGGMRRTIARAEMFDFPTNDCGEMDVNLYVQSKDHRYAYDDAEALDGMRVGVEQASAMITDLKYFCQQNSITMDTVEYPNQSALFAALQRGEVDGVCAPTSPANGDVRCVACLPSHPFHFMATKGRTDLVNQLDKALQTIKITKRNFEPTLRSRYFPSMPGDSPMLTRAEFDYIESAEPLNVAYIDNWPPLEDTDDETGAFIGVHAEVLSLVSELSGLQFNYIPMKSRIAIHEALNGQSLPIIASIPDTAKEADDDHLRLTQPYLSVPVVMIARSVHPNEEITVAMPRTAYLYHMIAEEFPDYTIVDYTSSNDCVAAVRSGKATATFLSEYMARDYMQASRNSTLSATPMNDLVLNYCIGVSPDADPQLVSILNKALSCVNDDVVQEYLIANTLQFRPQNLFDLLMRNPALWAALVVASIVVLSLLMVINTINKSRHAKELYRIVNVDALTGAPSAYCFHQEAEKLLRTVGDTPYVFLYMNIRKFKDINSLYGYSFGDDVLRCLNSTLHAACHENECYGRIYADRFELLLRYTNEATLFKRFDQLNQQVADTCHSQHGLANLRLVGGAALVEEGDKDIHAVIDRANYACQQAMADSTHDLVMFSNALAYKISLQRTMEKDMVGALENGEFLVYYQPKINSNSSLPVGAETLIRWQHSSMGVLPPAEFISLFEKNAFILKTDLYVFEQVCIYQADRQRRSKPLYPISCNFSRLHLASPAFVDTLKELADRYGVAHSLMEVEITETVAMEDIERAQSMLLQLSEAGFSISIDDFGSGYSSLGLFSELNFDIVKIDRSLTTDATASPNRAILLAGLVNILCAMNKLVVCEGVESKAQVDHLRTMGCQIIQGYYYSRPLPEKDFDEKY